MSPNPLSYQSANTFPAKLLRYAKNLSHGLYPIHLQLYLTNKCNLDCSYCSCRNRTRDVERDYINLTDDLDQFIKRGLQSVTITGGGEPLMSPLFEGLVSYLYRKQISMGLVTNGILTKKWPQETFQKIEWIRVSFDADRKALPELYWTLGDKYAFSYVYSPYAEHTDHFNSLVDMARDGSISHLRVVSDITAKETIPAMKAMPDNVILQDRSENELGAVKCWISLVKPVLDVDGQVYPCCGVQYARGIGDERMPECMSMGTVDEYFKTVDSQTPFNGLPCVQCYYGMYNHALNGIRVMADLEHPEFI